MPKDTKGHGSNKRGDGRSINARGDTFKPPQDKRLFSGPNTKAGGLPKGGAPKGYVPISNGEGGLETVSEARKSLKLHERNHAASSMRAEAFEKAGNKKDAKYHRQQAANSAEAAALYRKHLGAD